MISSIDAIAEEHCDLINEENEEQEDIKNVLAKISFDSNDDDIYSNILFKEENDDIEKVASTMIERVFQGCDQDYHQNAETKPFWNIKNGKIVRVVPNVIKG